MRVTRGGDSATGRDDQGRRAGVEKRGMGCS